MNKFTLVTLTWLASALPAQADITDLTAETTSYKTTYAVYDIKPESLDPAVIEKAVLNAIRTYAQNAQVGHSIPPATLPVVAAKMSFTKNPRMNAQVPQCDGEIFQITASDNSFASSGEKTKSVACLFPYKDGYRLNYYAAYGQMSGGANTNILGAMLARAVGVGDSSKFIAKTLERIEENLKEQGTTPQLIQLYPKIEGKQVTPMEDPVQPIAQAAPVTNAPLSQPAPTQGSAMNNMAPMNAYNPMALMNSPLTANLSPADRAKLAEAMTQQKAMMNNYYGKAQAAPETVTPQPQTPQKLSPLQARKELTSIGMGYANADQFFEAVQRNDKLAVELFIAAQSIDLNSVKDKKGQTPLQVAAHQGAEQGSIAQMLRDAGEQK
ncbi:ankyrin repeat domain-containing protein [Sulfurirhabdus autotrophica]|uniref:Uncharacterized protein n=1 Tax=Sulfurirhabdus autotrophica TaxID=1706046 RepID=A0A4R3XWR3_9PROT|nr:ankyrin repeat domain-containing protein [Sulfurirhabdus autotrophica]TCV81219.1 hypothetical protein EDC63_1257 [Sulfurirhabdus autotrophica]